MAKLKSPLVVNSIFKDYEFQELSSSLKSIAKSLPFDSGFGRFFGNELDIPILKEYTNKILNTAREIFDSPTLLPTYSLFVHYETDKARLWKHVDDNACTYTLDMCVYQNFPWNLWVEDKEYVLNPNQALAYYGNDQEHWRENFPYPDLQHVAMVFFHFAEPDHWYFTEGPEYLHTNIRKKS